MSITNKHYQNMNKFIVTLEINNYDELQLLNAFLQNNQLSLISLNRVEAPLEEKPTLATASVAPITVSQNSTELVKSLFKSKLGRHGLAILKLLSDGKSYVEVAAEIGITLDGVRFYVKKIYKALGVSNGRDAVRIYLTDLSFADKDLKL
jgi:DNA-binding NarL/FixJ family response regulator